MITRSGPWLWFQFRIFVARIISHVYTEILEAYLLKTHGVLRISYVQTIGGTVGTYVVWRLLNGRARVFGERRTFGEADMLVERLCSHCQKQCICQRDVQLDFDGVNSWARERNTRRGSVSG